MLVKIVLTLVSFRPSFFHTSAHPNEIPHSNNYMSNPAGWKVIYSRLAFTMPLKTVLCYPSRLWPLFTYMFPITLLMHPPPFSQIFLCHLLMCHPLNPLQYVPSTSVSLSTCVLHTTVSSLSASLINSLIHLQHLLVSRFRLLKLNKRPGVLHFSTVKQPGVCRLARSETS